MIDFKKLMIEEKKKLLLEKQQKEQQQIKNTNNDKQDEQQQQIKVPVDDEKKKEELKVKAVNFDQVNIENLEYLKQYKFGTIESIYYIDEFISKEEEETLLSNIYNDENNDKWVQLKRRRLQNWGGNPISTGMIEEELPSWLQIITEKIYKHSIFPTLPNHVLLNEYSINEGIFPHTDGPLFYPCVCILSLSSTCLMDFYKTIKEDPFEKIFLKPRSLLIFTNDAYKKYYHGIKESFSDIITSNVINSNDSDLSIGKEIDRDLRVSLTIRIVPNTISK